MFSFSANRASKPIRALWLAAVTLPVVLPTLTATASSNSSISFNRDIRPILSDKCFRCHGPDANARKANLRLDLEEGARQALVPGRPDQSRVYLRITENDRARRMPPPESHLTLTQPQIDLIRRWIQQGAKYEKHWSLIPPT